jgi:hypothetical protein
MEAIPPYAVQKESGKKSANTDGSMPTWLCSLCTTRNHIVEVWINGEDSTLSFLMSASTIMHLSKR